MDWPNKWILRDLETFLKEKDEKSSPLGLFPVILLIGPRQVGKTSLLKKISGENTQFINFDELEVRARAKSDPILFGKELAPPLFIDEIQYVPEILSTVKVLADKNKRPGQILLSGSQNFQVMKGVRESLAGRVAILNLFGLTDHEKALKFQNPINYFSSIIQSNFPVLQGRNDEASRRVFLDSYVQTYIEKDVMEILGIIKRREFEIFVRLCALRTGQEINYSEIAKSAGITEPTVKEWMGLLEDSFLIKIVPPFLSNRNKRLIKTPKIFFLDLGLAAFLGGWRDGETLRLGPQGGAFFESHIFSNLYRNFKHSLRGMDIFYWRTKEKKEIDFIIEYNRKLIPLEVKMGTPSDLIPLKDTGDEMERGIVVSLAHLGQRPRALNEDWDICSPEDIYELILSRAVS